MKHYSPRCILNLVLRLVDLESSKDPNLATNLPFRLDTSIFSIIVQEYDKNQVIRYNPEKSTKKCSNFLEVSISLIDCKRNLHTNVFNIGYYKNKIYLHLFLLGYWCEFLEGMIIEIEKTKYKIISDRNYFLDKLESLIQEEKDLALEKQMKSHLYLGDEVI